MRTANIINHKAFLPTILGLFAGVYYYALYSRIFTWIYTTGDAGDWLTQLRWWMVPHAFGKPLYILGIKVTGLVPFGTDIDKITIGLSVIPAAITVAVAYLIALELTKDRLKSTAAALVVLGAGIFLSQATVVEQYTFTAMFIALAYLNYIRGNKKLTLLYLGLTTATHIFGGVLLVLWAVVEWRNWRGWLKVSWVYVLSGILPYALILGLMAADTPRLMAGGLSWGTFDTYLSNPTSTAALALVAAPTRLFGNVFPILVSSLGLAIIPLFKVKKSKYTTIALITIGFAVWFYVTNLFPSTYKYVAMVIPLVAGMVALGLMNMKRVHTFIVIASAVVLIFANSILLNTNKLAQVDPQASEYIESLMSLPDGSGVIVPRGGAWGFGLFYVISMDKDLVPIAMHTNPPTLSYFDYLEWVQNEYGVEGSNALELTQNMMIAGRNVYFAKPPQAIWLDAFILGEAQVQNFLWQVTEVNLEAGVVNYKEGVAGAD